MRSKYLGAVALVAAIWASPAFSQTAWLNGTFINNQQLRAFDLNQNNAWLLSQSVPLSGGTLTGGITVPSMTATGTTLLPSSAGPEGAVTFPYNAMLYTADQFASTTGPVSTLLIRNNFGGGLTNGGRNTVLITSQLVGSIGTYNQNYVGQQIIMKDAGNVSGATSGAPLGSFFGLGVNLQIAAGSFAYGATGSEYDYNQATGSTVKYMEFMKFADFSPAGVTATVNSAFLRFESVNQAMNMGLTFGDPQAASNGFPVNSTGTLIYSYAGSAGVGIDMSLDTFATAFIKGPNSFQVDNTSDVHTRQIWANTTNFNILASNGTPYLNASGPSSPTAYISAVAVASGAPYIQSAGSNSLNIKTGGTAGVFNFYDSNNYSALVVNEVASPANYLSISGSVAASPVLLTATGSDANVGINLVTKGSGTVQVNGVALPSAPLSATSASIGGGALIAGACATTATTVTGATVGMAVVSTPNTFPGAGNLWSSYVSGANTVTTEICATIAATPTASTYNLRVFQ